MLFLARSSAEKLLVTNDIAVSYEIPSPILLHYNGTLWHCFHPQRFLPSVSDQMFDETLNSSQQCTMFCIPPTICDVYNKQCVNRTTPPPTPCDCNGGSVPYNDSMLACGRAIDIWSHIASDNWLFTTVIGWYLIYNLQFTAEGRLKKQFCYILILLYILNNVFYCSQIMG